MPGAREHVVVGAIVRDGNRVLLCRRSAQRAWYPGLWDLPGGHVLPGERPADAVARELGEELAIVPAVPAQPIAQVRGADYRMDVFLIERWNGRARNAAPDEHCAIGWFTLAEARAVELADTNLRQLLDSVLARGRVT